MISKVGESEMEGQNKTQFNPKISTPSSIPRMPQTLTILI